MGAPLPKDFVSPPETALEEVRRLRGLGGIYHFFHWELEFPDVFGAGRSGFDALVGNPPWEIQKPNSKEFFSNLDPLYRGYGKTDAESTQRRLFEVDSKVEHDWLAERARLKALLNWSKHSGRPYGNYVRITKKGKEEWVFPLGRGFEDTREWHRRWAKLRTDRVGYADPEHAYELQGSVDLNTYKMFLEAGYRLLRQGGRLGLVVPSGLYSDKGSTGLRRLFLDQSQWEWLFGFENREAIFDIHRSFKFASIVVQKGGQTQVIRSAFMHRALADWEDGEKYVLDYPRERVVQFSPLSKALLEIRERRDLDVLEQLYSNGILFSGSDGVTWSVGVRREFHLTDDAKAGLFRDRTHWEAEGYCPDEYSHWLLGDWQTYDGPRSILARPHDLVLSADGKRCLPLESIRDIALPLYEGRMVGQFDFSQKGWVRGKGRAAVWEDIPFEAKSLRPQYLMSLGDYVNTVDRNGRPKADRGLKVGFMDVTSATNERTTIATCIRDQPSGNSVSICRTSDPWGLVAVMNSFAFDYVARARCGGLHLNFFVIRETVLPHPDGAAALGKIGRQLTATGTCFAREWLPSVTPLCSWRSLWAVTAHERLRLRCILDAAVASLYEVTEGDFKQMLNGCDYPADRLGDDDFTRTLDPKGFWRVE